MFWVESFIAKMANCMAKVLYSELIDQKIKMLCSGVGVSTE